ncbi:MAG: hypothetical protein Q4Q53_08055, partial [Methanocorpusculum sp.]|nr:hypothetical protein [Methanocorpusculum sp.]
MERKHAYTNLSVDEYNLLDESIEQLEFTSRTDYFTACAHVLIYGKNPFEWNTALHTLRQKNELMKKTFFDTVHEKAFSIIAMNGTGAIISSGIIKDIKLELLEKCKMIP